MQKKTKISKSTGKDRKYPFGFYLTAGLIPFVLILLVELSLNLVGYGRNYNTFIELKDNFEGYLVFNPQLMHKFFTDDVAIPSPIPDAFRKEKAENTFRIFTLGGSTTAGFPYPPNASFSRQLKRRLMLLNPEKKFEVINLGVSAVNSIFIRNIIDDVLDQKPDLLILYAGHNEYYGAYGAASGSVIKGNNFLLPALLKIKEFATYQLTENLLNKLFSSFSSDDKKNSRTLMSEMAGKNLVEYNSSLFNEGLDQFRDNINVVFDKCKSRDIPVLVGNLTSNMKQRPLDFVVNRESEAFKSYEKAASLYESDSVNSALNFKEAIQQDEIRFRAPEEINKIISDLCSAYDLPMIAVDSVFLQNSERRITDSHLFADHLHPNIWGNFLIAKEFYSKMLKNGFISISQKTYNLKLADRILQQTFPFTGLDSAFAQIQIDLLTSTFPFTENSDPDRAFKDFPQNNLADSLAFQVVVKKMSWETAHQKMAEHFYNKKHYKKFFNEMMALIFDKPFDIYLYKSTIEYLVNAQQYELAITPASLLYNIQADKNSTFTMGLLLFKLENFVGSSYYLEQVFDKYDQNNPDLIYMLAVSRMNTQNENKAIELLTNYLAKNPNDQRIKSLLTEIRTN